eukprot:439022_1
MSSKYSFMHICKMPLSNQAQVFETNYVMCHHGCGRHWMKPLFTSIQNSINLYQTSDYTYVLPIPSSESISLNYLTIILHIILIILSVSDVFYINIFATNNYFPLYTISFYNTLPVFILTFLLYILMFFAIHVSIISPFLFPPSQLKYTDKEYWCIIIKSFISKSVLFAILFSISTLTLLYILLFIFILGNTPINYFKPNMQSCHQFHLHLNHSVIPQLVNRFNDYKSSQWSKQFVYLLFNCAILDEFITKKNSSMSPTTNQHSKSRVSFVNLLAGIDADKVLNRVSNDLEYILQLYNKYGTFNKYILDCNIKSWNNCHKLINNYDQIRYNFQYILYVLFPFHLLLFWIYIIFNNDDKFIIDSTSIIIIAIIQFIFYIVCILLLYIGFEWTIKKK